MGYFLRYYKACSISYVKCSKGTSQRQTLSPHIPTIVEYAT